MTLFRSKKVKKQAMDEEILEKIQKYRSQWNHINDIMENSIEVSEASLFDQTRSKIKYFFLLKEARKRNLRGTL